MENMKKSQWTSIRLQKAEMDQSKNLVEKSARITVKIVMKSLIPSLKHSLKGKPKGVYQTYFLHRHISGKLIPQPPQCHLLSQNAQSEAKFIEQSQISYLKAAIELLLPEI